MIIGLGLDLVEIARIEHAWRRFGLKFAERILHPLELAQLRRAFGAQPSPAPEAPRNASLRNFLAARFAAKEAAVKALGTGFSSGIGFKDMYVKNLPSGQPELFLLNTALARMLELGASEALLSLTHSRDTAAAVVILAQ
jgi:holo-[acyl-carrier protein] synthase